MKKIYVAYYPAKTGPEMIMTKSEKVRDKILAKNPFLKFEEVELREEVYNSIPETVLQKL